MLREIDTYQKIRKYGNMFVNKESLTTRSFLQYGAVSQIVGSLGIDIHHAFAPLMASIIGRLSFCGTAGQPKLRPKRPPLLCNRRIGISSSMYHNGTLAGTVVNTFFQSVQDEGISVPALIVVSVR